MKKLLPLFLACSVYALQAQTVLCEYSMKDNHLLIPKKSIEQDGTVITPVSVNKNGTNDIGLIFATPDGRIKEAYRFSGKDKYVINQIVPGQNGSILVAGEGYSQNNQESFYFMEFAKGKVLNSFIFNEGGNELDPFSIVETGVNRFAITGFVKRRELVGSFDFPMYNEEQLIYIGEFSKSGQKLWSNGISTPGYDKPSATKLMKDLNGFFILGSGDVNEKVIPLIIQTDEGGQPVKAVAYKGNGDQFQMSGMNRINNEIWLCGQMHSEGTHYISITILGTDLTERASYRIPSPGRVFPISMNVNKGYLHLSTSVYIKGKSLDNLAVRINLTDMSYQLKTWGDEKAENLIDHTSSMEVGSVIRPTPNDVGSIKYFKPIDWSGIKVFTAMKVKLNKTVLDNLAHTNEFAPTTLNQGVAKLEQSSMIESLKKIR